MPMPSKRPRFLLGAIGLAAAAFALRRPGDAPWIDDEPRLIEYALQNLRAGTWPWHGILGSHGLLYGPLAPWLYQLMLAVTRDLLWLVRLHVVLILGACAACVVRLADLDDTLEGPWGALALLSP